MIVSGDFSSEIMAQDVQHALSNLDRAMREETAHTSCPKCGRHIRLKREPLQGKARCPECGPFKFDQTRKVVAHLGLIGILQNRLRDSEEERRQWLLD